MNDTNKLEKWAVLAILVAGISWGVICIFIKQLSAAGLGAMDISFVRMLVAAILFTGYVLIKEPGALKISIKDIWMFIGTGIISITLFNSLYFYTTINSESSIAVVLLYTSPIFIMLLSAILFKEKITAVKIVALVLTFVGCILVAGIVGSGTKISAFILLTGVLAGLFYALYTIFGRYALAKYDTTTVTVWTFIFGLIGTACIADLKNVGQVVSGDPSVIWFILGIGLVSTLLPYVLYTWGLKYVESGKAAIIVAIEPVVGALIGIIFYGERANFEKILGLLLIVAAIALLNAKKPIGSA